MQNIVSKVLIHATLTPSPERPRKKILASGAHSPRSLASSACAAFLQHQIENLHLPHRKRREEREGREGESGILRHKNVHFGEEDKMYEGAKKEGEEERLTGRLK